MRNLRIAFALVLLTALLLVAAASTYGLPQLQIPSVPHPIEGREDCLACHDLDQVAPFPEDHEGRPVETCTGCHEPGEVRDLPPVPHPLEDRDDCLECHDLGQIVPFPEDHEGRANETCLACHVAAEAEAPEPTPSPTATLPPSVQAVPTPIQEPELFGENMCIACHEDLGGKHADITADWAESVHAAEGVGCVSCHGGDPTEPTVEESMSPEAGYLGPLPKDQIPGLCGSCHTRVDLMRPYDLPTDQLDQYWQSQHGQALLEGDTKVATCFDCHDGHRVLEIGDPASEVYPLNEPEMCARCHSDETFMAEYDIPTNQFELYRDSVHGLALLQRQELRAPSCSTCHGTHGAAPPGFEEVANVCGRCHSATEDYYLQGAHRRGMMVEAAPRCVTCHGRYDVPPATRDLFLGTDERHCGSCHPPGSDTAGEVQAMYEALTQADEAFERAEALIAEAVEMRLIMAEEEELLAQARTPLIESRALQHNVRLEEVETKAEESLEASQQVQSAAREKLEELDTRRLAMVIVLAVILVTVVALVLIKRELDRELEARRAQQQSGSS